jgi:hypothetical protein
MSRGAVYVALGPEFLAMALVSIKSLKIFNPDIPVLLITSERFEISKAPFLDLVSDRIEIVDVKRSENRRVKLSVYSMSPFEKTLYIDCDTYITQNLDLIFSYLDYFDVAFRLNDRFQVRRGKGDCSIIDGKYLVSQLPHWNSGVFAFTKSLQSQTFFDSWKQKFVELGNPFDQVSLADAVFSSEARILSLPFEWNFHPGITFFKGKDRGAKIVHYTNRISPTLQREILRVSELVGIDTSVVERGIENRIKNRRDKIGLKSWLRLNITWIFSRCQEQEIFSD